MAAAVSVLLLVPGGADAARARSHVRPPSSGVPSPAPTAASQAATLAQLTGLTGKQVTTRDVCPAPAPGFASCQAHVAVLRSSGALVRPRIHPQRALADVAPRHRPTVRGSAASALATPLDATASEDAGQAAPAAGTPAWLQQAYDLSYLSTTGGVGDTVAVVDAYDDPTAESDLATFRSTYGLPDCTSANGCFEQVNEAGTSSPQRHRTSTTQAEWETEESLDLDAVSSLCPNCHIILVEATSAANDSLIQAIQDAENLGANQLSLSWAVPSSSPVDFLPQDDPSSGVAGPPVTAVAATGDQGYLGPGQDAYPAAESDVTAAGGTTLAPAGGARGFGESAWGSALSDGTWQGTGSGCDQSEPQPPWQAAIDTGCADRAYSDVSADADPATGLSIYDSAAGGWELVGGTSLATPLIAAYEAITGVDGATPQWAYTDSALLNDPVSGSNGLCATSIFCNAGPGYDGPTGVGSISGQVVTGAPGIGGPTQDLSTDQSENTSYASSVTSDSASLTGGVYPNGLDTTYWWEYGTTTAYGEQTPAIPTDIGAGTNAVAVSDTLTDLSPSTTYHYRLVAQNSAGTTYGYDFTLTTPSVSSPSVQSAPSSGAASGSTSTSGSDTPGTASGGSTTTPTTPAPTGGTTTTPAPTGGTTTTSPAPVPVTTSAPRVSSPTPPSAASSPPPAPVVVAAPRLTGTGRVGSTITVRGGSYRNATVSTVQFERCAHSCRWISGHGAGSYKLTAADAGEYLRARVTVRGAGGSVTKWVTGAVGPVRSATAGAIQTTGAGAIRGSAGKLLARVSARTRSSRSVGRGSQARSFTVRFTRPAGIRGTLQVWVCTVRSGTMVSCTAPRSPRGSVSFTQRLTAGERLEMVAVSGR